MQREIKQLMSERDFLTEEVTKLSIELENVRDFCFIHFKIFLKDKSIQFKLIFFVDQRKHKIK